MTSLSGDILDRWKTRSDNRNSSITISDPSRLSFEECQYMPIPIVKRELTPKFAKQSPKKDHYYMHLSNKIHATVIDTFNNI